ncbi:hypothetical protein BS78_09G036000 [Paspalum vaginatum]|nr:hypothetical protein BS78_09G036000 [Paspalum vaginatum]
MATSYSPCITAVDRCSTVHTIQFNETNTLGLFHHFSAPLGRSDHSSPLLSTSAVLQIRPDSMGSGRAAAAPVAAIRPSSLLLAIPVAAIATHPYVALHLLVPTWFSLR